jgi:aldehyde:ferredoxin oxidoreductase
MEARLFRLGSIEDVFKALAEIEKGTILGRVLGQGASITARVLGLSRVPAVLGQAIPAHDPRVCKPVGVTYATSPMGADHTAGLDYSKNPMAKETAVTKSKQSQIRMAAIDTVGYCLLAMPSKEYAILPIIAKLLGARYGNALTDQDILQIGERTLKEELAFNLKAGVDTRHDRLPRFLKTESLPPQNMVFDVPRNEIERIWEDLLRKG